MNTIDLLISDLCKQIDYWKESAEYWEEMYKKERDVRDEEVQESLKIARQGVANVLRFALSVRDGENGDLIIKKEDRDRFPPDLNK